MENVLGKREEIANSEILQLVTFIIANEEYGVDIMNIQGINRMVDVTRLPNTPEYVEGIINLRGKIIPLVDLRRRLGNIHNDFDKSTRFIVVEINKIVIGFIVDRVNEVLRIPLSITEAPPAMTTGINSDFITSVAKFENRLIILLDLAKTLSVEQHEELSNIAV
jgi:purine-binding chemotaxis protein CheW